MGLTGAMARAAVAIAGMAALVLPLAACSTTMADTSALERANCPAEIRIQTDALPNADWGFLYSMLDRDAVSVRFVGHEVSGPLLVDGEDSGIRLTILSGDRFDGVGAAAALHDDESLLLGAVDTDSALLDVRRYPTVGLFAPTLRDTRIVYWSTETYPAVVGVEGLGDTLAPDGVELAPIGGVPGDLFRDAMVGAGTLGPEQVDAGGAPTVESYLDAGGLAAQVGDVLVDPYLLGLRVDDPPIAFEPIDEAGYTRDTLLAAAPQTLVRYADCFRVLIPLFQRAIVDYLDDPEPTTELMARVATAFGHPELDLDLLTAAHDTLVDRRIVGNGRDDAVGDIDFGRLRDLLSDLSSAWLKLERDFPQVTVEDVVTNDFIDRSIGL